MSFHRIALAAIFALCSVATAHAGLEACNRMNVNVSVSIGYKDGDSWASEGWWTIAPGDCSTMLAGDLKNRYYYWRATTSDGALPAENYFFCTSPREFTILGDTNCEARGYDRVAFTEADTGDSRNYVIEVSGNHNAPAAPDDEYARIRSLMQGDWVLDIDDGFHLAVRGERIRVSVDGGGTEDGSLEFAPVCRLSEGDGPVVFLTPDSAPADRTCLLVLNIDPGRMELYDYADKLDLVFIRP